jgi:hypothetical protein
MGSFGKIVPQIAAKTQSAERKVARGAPMIPAASLCPWQITQITHITHITQTTSFRENAYNRNRRVALMLERVLAEFAEYPSYRVV